MPCLPLCNKEAIMRIRKHKSLALALTLLAGTALAQPVPAPSDLAPPTGYRMGPGMMGQGPGYRSAPGIPGAPAAGYGMHRGMPGGWSSGCPMGPGMSGWGPGVGMSPGYGMGPAMGMGGGWGTGYGMEPGMPGFGMMGPGIGRAQWLPDLDDSQRNRLLDLQEELRARHWEIAGEARKELVRLHSAWRAPKRDREAILAAWQRLGELHRKAVEQSLDAADQMDTILTDSQREELRNWPW